MDNARSKETHFSFPEFQYSDPEDKAQMPDQSASQPRPDKGQTTPRIPIVSPYFPLRCRILTQLGSTLSFSVVSLRALASLCWLLDVDATRWVGPLLHVVVFDKLIIGTFLGVWYMRFLVQVWEADLLLFKIGAAAQGDARAKADIEALEEKRDWDMLLKHRPFNLSWIFGTRK